MSKKYDFALINKFFADSAWNGSPQVLQVNDSVSMPQTTNGTMLVSMSNQATQNNQGSIAQTSGGGEPAFFTLPALAGYPEVEIKNFNANNLNLTNISANAETPIKVYCNRGPVTLTINGKEIGMKEPNEVNVVLWESVTCQ